MVLNTRCSQHADHPSPDKMGGYAGQAIQLRRAHEETGRCARPSSLQLFRQHAALNPILLAHRTSLEIKGRATSRRLAADMAARIEAAAPWHRFIVADDLGGGLVGGNPS